MRSKCQCYKNDKSLRQLKEQVNVNHPLPIIHTAIIIIHIFSDYRYPKLF